MPEAYRDDLAFIHDAGFGHIARAAAPVLIAELHRAGLDSGRVVELGCGSGIFTERIIAAGFDVLGIDLSPAMIEIAKARSPKAEFRQESLLTADLPPCVAVTAIGECSNYLFDVNHSPRKLWSLYRRVFAALRPGGVFLFDVSSPGRVPGDGPRQHFVEGDGWAVLVTATEDRRRGTMVREITTFRRIGELYRRDQEVHRLRLLPPEIVIKQLKLAGFRVRTMAGYGSERIGPGHCVFVARKPTGQASKGE